MNRRGLIKAIMSVIGACLAPIAAMGFGSAAEQRLTTQQSDGEIDDGILPVRAPNGSLIWAAAGGYYPQGFRKAMGEGICNRCHRKFKEHSADEFAFCIDWIKKEEPSTWSLP